jgi:hypothetical protein
VNVTVRRAKNISIVPRRVSLPEIYSSISENLRIAYTNDAERFNVEVTLTHGGAEVGRATVLPDPVAWVVGRASSEKALAPGFQMRGLDGRLLS